MTHLKIKVTNPNYEKEYITRDRTLSSWINFLINHRKGNEDCFYFSDITGKYITINPKHFASVEVMVGIVLDWVD